MFTSRAKRRITSRFAALGLLAATLILAPGTSASGGPVALAPRPRSLTLSEDFNAKTIDAKKWTIGDTATNWNGLGTGNCHLASNVWIANGKLHLKSTVTPEPITCRYPSGHTFQTRRTSAEVYTMDKHAQTYGTWEIRARFPTDSSLGVSALWMYPQKETYGAWPRSGEINIVERMPWGSQWAYNSVHYLDSSGGTSYVEGDGDGNPGETGVCTVDMTQWHVYAVTWSSTQMTFTIDGNDCSSMGWAPLDLVPPAPFDQPFYLRLLQAGTGDAEVAQHRVTEVDWVRVYR